MVVTGAGIVTALGQGWAPNAAGFREGRAAFSPISRFDVSARRARHAAQASLAPPLHPGRLPARRFGNLDRAARLLLAAAREAAAFAGPEALEPRCPVVLSTTSAGMNLGEAYYRLAVHERGGRRAQVLHLDGYFVGRHIDALSRDLGLEGPFTTLSSACAAGGNAVGHAWELVRHGRCDQAIAGGYDALSELVFSGFDTLQALSPTVCRPFDRDRDGLALGEGAAVLILESLERARARGARILGEVAGYGLSTDLHHLTQPHPGGLAACASMRAACSAAQAQPGDIDYINAHGTGTPLNDSSETAAIHAWAGEAAERIPVSSTKGCVGHLLGAAGAVEAVVCLMALRGQWLPPNASLRTPDPACRFPLPRDARAPARLETALSNSFGFGGSNATLIFRRWHE